MADVVIIDLGKTNSRAILADLTTRQEIAVRRMENRVLPGLPYPHLDVDGQAAFILGALAEFAAIMPLSGVMVIGHGATVALGGSFGVRAYSGQTDPEVWLSEADAAMWLRKKGR